MEAEKVEGHDAVAGQVERSVRRSRWPKYRVSMWLDTSQLVGQAGAVKYGVETQRCKGGGWMHCHDNGEPLIYDDSMAAANECARLLKTELSA